MAYEIRIFHQLTEDCIALRTEVFVNEQGFCEEFDEIDERAVHICLYDGSCPAATGRLYTDDGISCHIGRVAVDRAYRKKQLGRMVMTALEEQAVLLGYREAALSAQLQAAGFYEKMGYAAQGEVYMDQHCPHILMTKKLV